MLLNHTNIILSRRCQYLIWMDTLDTFLLALLGLNLTNILIRILFLGTSTAKSLSKTMNVCGTCLCKKTGFLILFRPVSE